MTEARLHDIESKISYQELLLEQLNEALTSQQKQLDMLSKQLGRVVSLLEAPRDGIKHPDEETPPPHY